MIELSKRYVWSSDAQDTFTDAKETIVTPQSKCPVRKDE